MKFNIVKNAILVSSVVFYACDKDKDPNKGNTDKSDKEKNIQTVKKFKDAFEKDGADLKLNEFVEALAGWKGDNSEKRKNLAAVIDICKNLNKNLNNTGTVLQFFAIQSAIEYILSGRQKPIIEAWGKKYFEETSFYEFVNNNLHFFLIPYCFEVIVFIFNQGNFENLDPVIQQLKKFLQDQTFEVSEIQYPCFKNSENGTITIEWHDKETYFNEHKEKISKGFESLIEVMTKSNN